MQTTENEMQDRIGSALFRLAELGQRADTAMESPKAAGKLLGEVRKLAAELERMLADMREMAARYLMLQDQAAAVSQRGDRIFELSPVPCLLIDLAGAVVDANPAAVRLLNVSQRHLVGRSFPLFLNGDRDAFLARLTRLGEDPERSATMLRPRERSAVGVNLVAWRDSADRVFVMLVSSGDAAADAPGGVSEPHGVHSDAPA
jgi:PAS domain S-box-containing protein